MARGLTTKKGNPTAKARREHSATGDGRFPIHNSKTARAALRLRGHATNASERSRIISRAARYAPTEARRAREADKRQR